jgi:hypothetical protein
MKTHTLKLILLNLAFATAIASLFFLKLQLGH